MSVHLTNSIIFAPFSATEIGNSAGSAVNSRYDVHGDAHGVNDVDGEEASFADKFELSREAEEIRQLQARDQEVRAHEMAHAAIGGTYAGPPTYTYERGPDGRNYAVGGSVSIDVSPVPGDPQATLQKAQQVRAAALAPLQPSAKDMQVAQQAQGMAEEARNEIRQEQMEERKDILGSKGDSPSHIAVDRGISAYTKGVADPGTARLEMVA